MIIDLVIPTYKRKEKLIRCLDSIPKQDNVKIWVYFDNNAFDDVGFFQANYNIIPICVTEQKRAFGCWNEHLCHRFKADIFCYLCDDTTLYEDTFTNIVKHFTQKFPDTDGVVTFNQVNIEGSDSAMGCIGRKFLNRYPNRQAFNPNYVSFYADTDLGDYAKKLGKFYYGEDCRINHYHPAFYKEEQDEAHSAVRDEQKNIDIRVNKQRKELGLIWGESLKLIDRDLV